MDTRYCIMAVFDGDAFAVAQGLTLRSAQVQLKRRREADHSVRFELVDEEHAAQFACEVRRAAA